MGNQKDISKKVYVSRKASRKWKLVLIVLTISTIFAFAPPLLSIWVFGAKTPLILLSDVSWVSIISILFSSYFASNIYQRHVELQNGIDTQYIDGQVIGTIDQNVDNPEVDASDIDKEA